MAQRKRAALLILAVAAGLSGCGEAPASGGWAGSVDTLADGRVVVHDPARGTWEPATRWSVEESLRIGEAMGEKAYLFGDVRAIAADDLGRIWVLDTQAKEIRIFGTDGRHVRSVGREGEGPGELMGPNGLVRGPEGNMWVVDPMNARVTVFDTAGHLLRTYRREYRVRGYTWPGGFDGSGRMYDRVRLEDGGRAVIRRGPDLSPRDTLAVFRPEPDRKPRLYTIEFDRGRAVTTVPFTARPSWTVGPEGRVWVSSGEPYRIAALEPEGDTVRVVEREWEAPAVTDEERSSEIRELRDRFGEEVEQLDFSRIPRTKPAVAGLFFDGLGYLWVRVHVSGEPPGRHFDVFDPRGPYLGRLELPLRIRSAPRPVVTRDHLYALHRDEELDFVRVVRFDVDRRQ